MSRLLVESSFFKEAEILRSSFDRRFADPRKTNADRFVWDYWNVQDQYRLLRTPAHGFFQQVVYNRLHRQLVLWGRRVLGCHDISPPWLSCYVDGCEQKLHGDLPHGPFAFVYSLTRWNARRFSGGETLLVKDPILSYWQNRDHFSGLEQGEILEKVAPKFNQLLVFDPRIPHGVNRVEGAHDVRYGRLVIHGWFVQPRPFIEGALSKVALSSLINKITEELQPKLEAGISASGIVSLKFEVPVSGKVSQLRVLTNTLRGLNSEDSRQILSSIRTSFRGFRFLKQKGHSSVTLPLIFE